MYLHVCSRDTPRLSPMAVLALPRGPSLAKKYPFARGLFAPLGYSTCLERFPLLLAAGLLFPPPPHRSPLGFSYLSLNGRNSLSCL